MPITSSFSGASARALGLTSSGYTAIGNGYWINKVSKVSTNLYGVAAGNAIAVDSSGNVHYCGYERSSGGEFSGNVMKLNSSSAITWQRKLDKLSVNDFIETINIDSSGNVYVFGGADGPTTNDRAGVYIKYNSSGVLQWQKKLVDTYAFTSIYDSVIDSSGNFYLCGTTYNNTTNLFDGFVAKLDSSGAIVWQRRMTSSTTGDSAYNLYLDASSNVYVTQDTGATGSSKFVLLKYNSSGSLQWQRELTGSGYLFSRGVLVDSSGSVYVSGFDRDNPAASPVYSFLVKYNSSGVLQWQKRTNYSAYSGSTGNNPTWFSRMDIDSSDNIYVINASQSIVTIGGVEQGSPTLIQKFDSSGNQIYARNFNINNAVATGGSAVGGISIYGNDMYLRISTTSFTLLGAKLPADGSKTGNYQVGGTNITYNTVNTTVTTGTLLDAAGSLTDSAGSLTSSTAGLTDSANDLAIAVRD